VLGIQAPSVCAFALPCCAGLGPLGLEVCSTGSGAAGVDVRDMLEFSPGPGRDTNSAILALLAGVVEW
jgi:hypothetical protein